MVNQKVRVSNIVHRHQFTRVTKQAEKNKYSGTKEKKLMMKTNHNAEIKQSVFDILIFSYENEMLIHRKT